KRLPHSRLRRFLRFLRLQPTKPIPLRAVRRRRWWRSCVDRIQNDIRRERISACCQSGKRKATWAARTIRVGVIRAAALILRNVEILRNIGGIDEEIVRGQRHIKYAESTGGTGRLCVLHSAI